MDDEYQTAEQINVERERAEAYESLTTALSDAWENHWHPSRATFEHRRLMPVS